MNLKEIKYGEIFRDREGAIPPNVFELTNGDNLYELLHTDEVPVHGHTTVAGKTYESQSFTELQ